MYRNLNWSERHAHMYTKHGITTTQAEEALDDPERVVLEPDYASRSGKSVRVIGYAASIEAVLTVIVVLDDESGQFFGGSGWRANRKDQSIYYGIWKGDDEDEQDQ